MESKPRIMRLFKIAAKSLIRAKLQTERGRIYRRRDNDLIEKLELSLVMDELIELELEPLADRFIGNSEGNSVDFSTKIDSDLIRDIIDWLGSDEFAKFLETLLKFIETLVGLF